MSKIILFISFILLSCKIMPQKRTEQIQTQSLNLKGGDMLSKQEAERFAISSIS